MIRLFETMLDSLRSGHDAALCTILASSGSSPRGAGSRVVVLETGETMGMRHLFLTGEVQVGKSTLIRRLLAAHPGWRLGGFQTVTRWAGRQGSVYLIPARAGMEACTADACVGLRDLDLMRPVSRPEVFDRIGPGLLSAERADLLIMDELGTMEQQAKAFCGAVLRALDGDLPVLGVIKPRSSALLDAVRAHPRVQVLTVTRENREELLKTLEDWAAEKTALEI